MQLIDELAVAFAWMFSLGVAVAPERLAAYRKMAEKWNDFNGGRGKLGARELAPIVATFGYEVNAFIAIAHAFGGTARAELGGLITELGLAAGGPVRIDAARSRDARPARDALFRALTAAYVRQATGMVAFGIAGSTGFALGRHRLHVVCARSQRDDGSADVKAACAELLTVFDGRQMPRSRGLVALDVSALITPPGQAPPTQQRTEMVAAADRRLAQFIDAQMDTLQDGLQGMDRRIIGLMLLSSSMAVAADDGAFVHLGRWVLVWREHISFSDFEVLDQLRGLLQGGAAPTSQDGEST